MPSAGIKLSPRQTLQSIDLTIARVRFAHERLPITGEETQ